nr:MAG TPA: hypothetical protein [Caudoviricetes sp.]
MTVLSLVRVVYIIQCITGDLLRVYVFLVFPVEMRVFVG